MDRLAVGAERRRRLEIASINQALAERSRRQHDVVEIDDDALSPPPTKDRVPIDAQDDRALARLAAEDDIAHAALPDRTAMTATQGQARPTTIATTSRSQSGVRAGSNHSDKPATAAARSA
jgi:hypothetical protein